MDLAERWERELDGVPGAVSIQLRTADGVPVAGRRPDAEHYAASTMKLAVLVAAHAEAMAGRFDLDADLPVHDAFRSALGGTFTLHQADDQDDATWRRLGGTVPASTLLERMIADSSNIATNLVIEQLGMDPVRAVHPGVTVHRLIGDQAAEAAGITNTVTAAGLSGLLAELASGALLHRAATDAALAVLAAQRHRRMIPAGLPADTWSASKGGWTGAVNHDVALVRPAGPAPAYVLAVCTSTRLDADAERLVARLSAVTWAHWTAAA